MTKPIYAPGCYGNIYGAGEGPACGECIYASDCVAMAAIKREQLGNMYLVKVPTRKKSELPVKVRKEFESLGVTKSEVYDAFREGRNPYKISDGAIGVVSHLLLGAKRATRARLSEIVSLHCQLRDTTAEVYVRYAIQILVHCGVAVEEKGEVSLV